MPGPLFANNATGTLAASYGAAATALTLTGGQGSLFPSPTSGDYFMATIVNNANVIEIVKCTSRNVDTLTVVRGQEGTAARALVAGEKVDNRLTAGALTVIRSTPVDPLTIPDGSVPGSKIMPNTIGSAQIQDRGIGAGDIYAGTITNYELAAGVALQNLGFTPVRQGGGVNQLANTVFIGWTNVGKIAVTVDATDWGYMLPERQDGSANSGGYRGAPPNYVDYNYNIGLPDAGGMIIHQTGTHTYYLPTDATPFVAGTLVQILNMGGGLSIVPQSGVNLCWVQNNTYGGRNLVPPGICSLYKAASNMWYIFGQNIT